PGCPSRRRNACVAPGGRSTTCAMARTAAGPWVLGLAAIGLLLVPPLGCGEAPPARAPASTAHPTARALAPRAPAPTASAAEPASPAAKPHRFAVAAENATAMRVAMDVLEQGGSAVDAAIAGVLTTGVTQPVSIGIGGGGFAVVWDAKTKAIT